MTNRFHDFDAAFAEQAEEPIVVRLFGDEWEIPADPPAAAVLRQQRLAAAVVDFQREGKLDGLGEDDDVPDALADLLSVDMDLQYRDMLGDDNVTAWLERGIGDAQLKEVLRKVTEIRNGGGSGNRAARRAKAGSASATSSRGGRSSKPTSSGSTGST